MKAESEQPDVSTAAEASAMQQMGNRIEEFGPNTANLVVGYVFGILLGIAGVVVLFFALKTLVEKGGDLPFQAKQGASWIAVGWGSVLGLGALVGGIALVFYMRSLFASSLWVCSEGFFTINRGRIELYPWSDLERIEETIQQQYVPLKGVLKKAVPMDSNRMYLVRRKDGKEFTFDGDSVRRLKRLARLLQEHAERASIPWHVIER